MIASTAESIVGFLSRELGAQALLRGNSMPPQGFLQSLRIARRERCRDFLVFRLPPLRGSRVWSALTEIRHDLKLQLKMAVGPRQKRIMRRLDDGGVERGVGANEARAPPAGPPRAPGRPPPPPPH